MDSSFWRDKRVLLTGHTGFKGAWLGLWLSQLGARVWGFSLAPDSEAGAGPNLSNLLGTHHLEASHCGDLCDLAALKACMDDAQPDIVFHLAAQALVRPSYQDPVQTFASNVMGTTHVLEAVRHCASVRVVVAVTTDKVYQNRESIYPYREDDALGGHDPYSASKAACEMVIACYRASFLAARGVALASARAGNVIGGGDWACDRLIPDAMRAWSAGQCLEVRHPQSVRPWQHVLEPLHGYMALAVRLWDHPELAGAFNFGPDPAGAVPVRQVVELARAAFGKGEVSWGHTEKTGPHEAGLLSLEVVKARHVLGVQARWPLETAVQRSMHWYKQWAAGTDVRDLCRANILAYEATA